MTLFLTQEEVLRAHETQIARYGGSTGIRDLGLLESALSMPQASFGGTYLHADHYEMAAAYLFHISTVNGMKVVFAILAYFAVQSSFLPQRAQRKTTNLTPFMVSFPIIRFWAETNGRERQLLYFS